VRLSLSTRDRGRPILADDRNPGFNLGDLVQLKSGGPVMTIERLMNGHAKAVWFAYGNDRSQFFEPR
jgi:uncharacterized protein YodC (DUF2158 family)